MSDFDRPFGSPQTRIRAQLERARTAGSWMPWAGAALAVLFWGGIGLWLFATMGPTLMSQPPVLLAGGFAAMLAPGLVLICAGIMARESARSAEANSIVLTSARQLLEPAETARDEIASIASAVRHETENVGKALNDTRGRLDGLKHEIQESVTAALKAAEIVRADSEVLVHKMTSERQSMTQLAESLRNQSENLAKAIPRHAQMMSEAAKAAQDQVQRADTTLTSRLRGLEETAANLAQRIDQLDNMGAESRKRAQNLAGALMRLDEQLVQSTRMVEAATKAGELATAATKSTAESLRDAVSDALGSAMKATETINATSARASEDAHQAMARLKEASLQTEATTRSAALAVRSHADETEQRVKRLSHMVVQEGTRAINAAESDLMDRARQRIERASQLVGKMKDEKGRESQSSIDDLILEPERPADRLGERHVERPPERVAERAPERMPERAPAPREEPRRPAAEPLFVRQPQQPAPPPAHEPLFARPLPAPEPLFARPPAASEDDDFLLDRPLQSGPLQSGSLQSDRGHPRDRHLDSHGAKPAASGFDTSRHNDDELVLDNVASLRRQNNVPPEPKPVQFDPLFPPEPQRGANASSWRDLLTGVEEVPVHQRERSAGTMIDRLDRAGVRLGVVKASDLRRIASASHQGERQRRRAIRDVAPSEIQRVARLLDGDRDLQSAARTFVHAEEPDALRVLAASDRAREDAHPRLSAYLLLDAALQTAL